MTITGVCDGAPLEEGPFHSCSFGSELHDTRVVRSTRSLESVVLADGTAIYDDASSELIMLNSSASAVWRRCDGTSTVDEIVAELSSRHEVAHDEILADVWLTIHQLATLGLVTYTG